MTRDQRAKSAMKNRIVNIRTALPFLIVAALTCPVQSECQSSPASLGGESPSSSVSVAAPSYPDWAAAVVAAYPNALPSSGPVAPNIYGIATTDALATVVAWYKSRVHGDWKSTEGGDSWSVKAGDVRIQISKNIDEDSGKEKPGTRIGLYKYR